MGEAGCMYIYVQPAHYTTSPPHDSEPKEALCGMQGGVSDVMRTK